MKKKLIHFIEFLAKAGTLPSDSPEERLRKATLTFIVVLIGIAAYFWGIMYIILGASLSGSIPLSYAVISTITLIHFFITKRYAFFRFSQLLMILILPFLLQWSLGGFHVASTVMIWAILSPMGALMFAGTRQALPWFISYIILITIFGFIDGRFSQNVVPFPKIVIIIFQVMSIGTVSTIIYILLQYFVRGREAEYERSEQLLLNILPPQIAERLKRNPETIADGFSEVTVLFADIVDFTRLSARISPEELVMLLNEVFSSFDQLAEKHNLEKIKTIGDAYMVVGGLPIPRKDHAEAVAEMALDMLDVLRNHKTKSGETLNVRIGINTGPVVAGVIGRKKFIYDLWGDAVNTASRMESHGLSGKIQVSEETYQKLKNFYNFENRGTIDVKGKGEMKVYILIGRKNDLNSDKFIT